ncbi:hypothetical protein [Tychonema sp. BBK16]|uniref:hypothetical protein n=1 Tax=Tychonema sp. BBK16 TaxID=2699888 RepID=UPI001F3E96A5|nr:hypothetical protein [Tychonema sp. BBK16]MCF6372970.1 hypothetical protein [Tychonema sp. BBK16]
MYIYAAYVGRHPWRSTKVTAIPKKSDCDEFNWLGDNNYTLLNSSLLFLAIGLTLRVAIAIASYEYFYPSQLVVIKLVVRRDIIL